MHFTLPRTVFLSALSRVLGVVPKVSPQAILTQVLLDLSDTLRLEATNGVMTAATSAPASLAEPGRICLPAHRLHAWLAAAPDGDVRVSVNGLTADLRIVGKKATGKIQGLDPTSFPELPAPWGGSAIAIPSAILSSLIARTAHAMAVALDLPAVVRGLHLEWDGTELRAVAFDNYRLALASVELKTAEAGSVLVPGPAVKEMRRLCSGNDVHLAVAGPRVYMTDGTTTVTSRLVDGDFPPYRKILPPEIDGAVVPVAGLVQAIGGVGALAEDTGAVVRIELASGRVVVSNRGDNASDEVDAVYAGAEIVVHCALKFIRDALASIDSDEVRLEAGGSMSPLVLRADGHYQMLMSCGAGDVAKEAA